MGKHVYLYIFTSKSAVFYSLSIKPKPHLSLSSVNFRPSIALMRLIENYKSLQSLLESLERDGNQILTISLMYKAY